MNDISVAMVEHGIRTSVATYWVHFFPLKQRVFWYRVDHCRDYIDSYKPEHKPGKSKDGTVTGAGYVIRQDAFFISSADVPKKYLVGKNWIDMTDRQAGFDGEYIVRVMHEHRVFVFPIHRASALRDQASQFKSVDVETGYFGRPTFEIKTERFDSANIFVQTGERGHKVHLTNDGTERVTDAPALT
jgi:hypothetical protein